MRRFNPILAKYFAEFHETFHGDTPETFQVCDKCGGACEFNKIGTLMPGEREYMAATMGLSVAEFSERFLDILVMPDGMELDVLRLNNGCPFLDPKTFKCNCREFKVVLCDIYPIVFQVKGGRVHFEIDDWCPLSKTLRFRQHFLTAGVAAISKLKVPVAWYRNVAEYDELYFDYVALQKYRNDRSKLQVFTLEELRTFECDGQKNGPKEVFLPFPAEVYQPPSPLAPATLPSPGDRPRLDRRS